MSVTKEYKKINNLASVLLTPTLNSDMDQIMDSFFAAQGWKTINPQSKTSFENIKKKFYLNTSNPVIPLIADVPHFFQGDYTTLLRNHVKITN